MINGVMHIVAAVLFAMIYLWTDLGMIWLWIAAAYLVLGIANLVVYAVMNHRKQKAARKAAAPAPAEESNG